MINSGRISHTRIGDYLGVLKHRFPPEGVVDMLCLIRIRLELSVQAKGLLLAREAGFELELDPMTQGRLDELRYLEGSIGRTGVLALEPIFSQSSRDLWQFYLLSTSIAQDEQ